MARSRRTRIALWIVGTVAGLVVVLAAAAGGYAWNNLTYAERDAEAVAEAGFVEKQAVINGSRVNYAEGPDNGPALPRVRACG